MQDPNANDLTTYLVSCVSKKQAAAACAKDLYVSEWFLRVRRYVEATGCPWFILSAKYGLIDPNQIIAPYEQTLNTMGVSERHKWAYRVQAQMAIRLLPAHRVVIFAGQRYREFLMDYLERFAVTVQIPLEGLRIGEQLSWLEHHAAR